MIYDLSNDLQAKTFKTRCNALYKKRCVVELTEKKPQRTLNQNSYLHAALGYFGSQIGYTLEEVKDWYFKEAANAELFVRQRKDRLTGEWRKTLRSSSELTVDEMTTAIERFRNWSADKAGIYIPSPDEHRLVAQMELEVMKTKEYI